MYLKRIFYFFIAAMATDDADEMSKIRTKKTKYSNVEQTFVYKYVQELFLELENDLADAREKFPIPSTYIELIVLITDGFSRLLSLSDKNETIKDLLNHLRSDIFRLPAAKDEKPHNDKTNKFSYICDVCDESITIFNQDLEFSIEHHNESPHHKKTEALFKHLQILSEVNQEKEKEIKTKTTETSFKQFQILSEGNQEKEKEHKKKSNLPGPTDDGRSRLKADQVKCKTETQPAESGADKKWRIVARLPRSDEKNETVIPAQETCAPANNINGGLVRVPFENREPCAPASRTPCYCTRCNISFSSVSQFRFHLLSHQQRGDVDKQANHNFSKTDVPIYVNDVDVIVEWENLTWYCVVCNKYLTRFLPKHSELAEHVSNVKQLENMIQSMILRLQKYAQSKHGMKGDKIRYCYVCDNVLPTRHKCICDDAANRKRTMIDLVKEGIREGGSMTVRDLYSVPLSSKGGQHKCRLCDLFFNDRRELQAHMHDPQHKSQLWPLKYFLDKCDPHDNAK